MFGSPARSPRTTTTAISLLPASHPTSRLSLQATSMDTRSPFGASLSRSNTRPRSPPMSESFPSPESSPKPSRLRLQGRLFVRLLVCPSASLTLPHPSLARSPPLNQPPCRPRPFRNSRVPPGLITIVWTVLLMSSLRCTASTLRAFGCSRVPSPTAPMNCTSVFPRPSLPRRSMAGCKPWVSRPKPTAFPSSKKPPFRPSVARPLALAKIPSRATPRPLEAAPRTKNRPWPSRIFCVRLMPLSRRIVFLETSRLCASNRSVCSVCPCIFDLIVILT